MSWPEINFVELDGFDLEQEIFSYYEKITGRKLYPGNPERLFLEALVYIIGLQRWHIDYTGKMNLLSYAEGEYLDHLGELLGVTRLEPTGAKVTIRFYKSEGNYVVSIPEGTRIAAGDVYFKTDTEATILAEESYVDVSATCESTGTIGNGFVPGQINTLVDPVSYIEKAENIDTSVGGTDAETDEHFRDRIRLAPESFSNAGSKGAYIFHAKSAHQDIEDVSVFSPEPGVVNVIFLLKDGEIPDSTMINLVQEYLTDEKVRPLTDQVVAKAPQAVNYDIDLIYYIHADYSALTIQIQEQVSRAIDKYVIWQGSKIGRDVLPEQLTYILKAISGVYRVELNSPIYTEITEEQVAKANNINIQYGGIVND